MKEHFIRLICSSKTTIVTFQHLRDVLITSNEILLDEIHVFGNEGNKILNILPQTTNDFSLASSSNQCSVMILNLAIFEWIWPEASRMKLLLILDSVFETKRNQGMDQNDPPRCSTSKMIELDAPLNCEHGANCAVHCLESSYLSAASLVMKTRELLFKVHSCEEFFLQPAWPSPHV